MDIVEWNEERMGRLERLYGEGLSFGLIADALGISRSAAIGKAHRMNLPKRSTVLQTKMKPVASSPISPRSIAAARPPPPPPPPPRPARKRPVVKHLRPEPDYFCSIYDLDDCSCRFPLWDTSTPHPVRRYCGFPTASVAAGTPYCRRHTRVAMTHRHE